MAAVDDLLERLHSIDRAIDALNEKDFKEVEIQEHLIRGIAVNGFVSIEEFVRYRMEEWNAVLLSARMQPSRLPGGTKQYEDRIVEVLPRALRDSDAAQRSQLLQALGQSLTSLSTGTLVPHTLAFRWTGSNLQASDIESIAALFGFDRTRAWSELTARWSQIDRQFPQNASLKSVFEGLAKLRHAAAHSGNPNIAIPNLSTITRSVKLVCLCLDIAIWQALRTMMQGTSRTIAKKVEIRRVIRDRGYWREVPPGSTRATRRHSSLEDAMREASTRATSPKEIVLALNEVDELVDWRIPQP